LSRVFALPVADLGPPAIRHEAYALSTPRRAVRRYRQPRTRAVVQPLPDWGSRLASAHNPENIMTMDKTLQTNVLAELGWEPSVTAAHIGVTAKDGIVTLTGHVQNYMEKYAAEKAAGRVKGVRAVVEEIEVRLPTHARKNDDEIAAALLQRLDWNVSVPDEAVRVKAEKGWVTLTGEVQWQFQKTAAEHDIRGMLGVVGISNLVTIKPRPNASDISADIRHALHRSWYDPKTISVSADGGAVRLSGTVGSWYDRQMAGWTAWGAPGAVTVENNISVV
jgi:osmotically-inducible protein OsmY